ncbi:uncharacterized protein LOC143861564 [Tasmannia lanceolata]|uniref:uncharacterized protein LOC143861564 n=1 Tax=Tasmannia lanceolata TaxID=3420 RepID=UPI004062DBFA
MANSTAEAIESELWKFLAYNETDRDGTYEIKIAKKPTIIKKFTYEQNRVVRTNVVIWVTASSNEIGKQLHGIFAKGSNKTEGNQICILHCRLFKDDPSLNAENSIRDLLADGLLGQEFKRSIEEGFLALKELMNSALIDDTDANFIERNDVIRDMRIPDSFFQKMEALRVISLSHTGISSLPSSLFQLSELRVLILSGCRRLAELPTLIGEHKKLEVLDLSNTQIKNLPKEICELINLEKLDLSNTQIRSLPMEISELINLKKLGLRELALIMIPCEISKLSSLLELDMFKTFIKWVDNFGIGSSSDSREGSELSDTIGGASLNQVINLGNLTSLQIMVEKFECVSEEIIRQLRRLTRFHLVIGPSFRTRQFGGFCDENYNKMLVIQHCKCSSLDGFSVLNDLECLIISSCGKLSTISLLVGAQRRLRDLRIDNCNELREMKGDADENPLRNLENLSLVSLPLLEEELGLGESLIKVQITKCPKLKNLQSSIRKIPRVKELSIGASEGVEELEETQLAELEKLNIYCIPQLRSIGLPPNMKVLSIWKCNELKNFPPGFCRFEKLEELWLSDVCEIENLIDMEVNGGITVLTLLGKLQLRRLNNFGSIWKGKLGIGCLRSLKEFSVSDCPKIKTLLPCGFGELKKLKEVYVSRCDGLEQILDVEVEDEEYELQSLERMHLTELPRLLSIFTGKSGIATLDNLVVLYLSHCSELKVVIPSCSQRLQKLRHIYVGHCDSIEYIIGGEGLLENALPSLERIIMVNLSGLKALWEGELGDDSLKSLKFLDVTKCPLLKNLLPSNLHKLEKVENIHVKDCDGMESIVGKNPVEGFALPGLVFLHLSNLGGIRKLWGKGMKEGALGRLDTLRVSNCLKLETLWDGELGVGALRSLKNMTVSNCPEIKILLPSNLKRLEKLEEVWLTNCGVEMIAGEMLEENVLQSLKRMELHNLPKLEILWGKGEHEAVALRELKMLCFGDCPSLKMLPFGLHKCSNLERLVVQECGSLEKIIRDTHEDAFPSLVNLSLRRLPNLKVISEKEMGVRCLVNLEYLYVRGLRGLRSFPPDLFKLRKLRTLHVGECDAMETLLEHEVWEENALANLEYLDIDDLPNLKILWEGVSQVSSLKSLKRLSLKGCQTLKKLPYGLLKLEKLEQLHVKNCDGIETIFREEGKEVALLSSLIEVKVEVMPQLIQVCEGIVIMSNLKFVTVIECPKLKNLSFVLNSSNIVSIRGGKDWWDALEFEGEKKAELHKAYRPWPADEIKLNRHVPRRHFLRP